MAVLGDVAVGQDAVGTSDAEGTADAAAPDAEGTADAAAPDAEGTVDACVPLGCGSASGDCVRIDNGCGGTTVCTDGCGLSRVDEPLVLEGAQVAGLLGTPVGSVRAYRWEGGDFVEIAAQVDERVLREWTPLAQELSYVFDRWGAGMAVVDDADAGAIDDDDEVALYAGDAGPLAPDGAWVAGAADRRYEIFLTDPLDGAQGAIYLFTFASPPPSSVPSIDYQRLDTITDETTIVTPGYRAHYANRWALDETSAAGCGGVCTDLIDRFKGRALNLVTGENEDQWADASRYVGDRSGPVRALREVKGASSGVSTTYIAEFYRERLVNTDYLRVHPVIGIWRYFDYHQDVTNLKYEHGPSVASSIDGFGDFEEAAVPDYYQVSSYSDQAALAQGSLVHLIQLLDISPVTGGASGIDWYYRDESSFQDGTGDSPGVAWGATGLHVTQMCGLKPNCAANPDQACCPAGSGSESHPLIGRMTTVVLPPAARQPFVADRYWTRLKTPLDVSVRGQDKP